jgi:hypothetical protein
MGRAGSRLASRSGLASTLVVAVGLMSLADARRAQAQAAAPAPAPTKSVYGRLLSVDKSGNNLLMNEDGGAQLAWHFDAAVIAEVARYSAGDPLIVIYRQTGPGPKDKRVTAIAFPGRAKTPIYVNMTIERIVLRTAASVGGTCDKTSGPVSESKIPSRGLAEAMSDCFCCAPDGQTCTPGTKTGLGRAYLVQCFK